MTLYFCGLSSLGTQPDSYHEVPKRSPPLLGSGRESVTTVTQAQTFPPQRPPFQRKRLCYRAQLSNLIPAGRKEVLSAATLLSCFTEGKGEYYNPWSTLDRSSRKQTGNTIDREGSRKARVGDKGGRVESYTSGQILVKVIAMIRRPT